MCQFDGLMDNAQYEIFTCPGRESKFDAISDGKNMLLHHYILKCNNYQKLGVFDTYHIVILCIVK